MNMYSIYRALCAPITKKGSIELTSRQIIILILFIIIAAIVIILGVTYSDQAKTYLSSLMNSSESFAR